MFAVKHPRQHTLLTFLVELLLLNIILIFSRTETLIYFICNYNIVPTLSNLRGVATYRPIPTRTDGTNWRVLMINRVYQRICAYPDWRKTKKYQFGFFTCLFLRSTVKIHFWRYLFIHVYQILLVYTLAAFSSV